MSCDVSKIPGFDRKLNFCIYSLSPPVPIFKQPFCTHINKTTTRPCVTWPGSRNVLLYAWNWSDCIQSSLYRIFCLPLCLFCFFSHALFTVIYCIYILLRMSVFILASCRARRKVKKGNNRSDVSVLVAPKHNNVDKFELCSCVAINRSLT